MEKSYSQTWLIPKIDKCINIREITKKNHEKYLFEKIKKIDTKSLVDIQLEK